MQIAGGIFGDASTSSSSRGSGSSTAATACAYNSSWNTVDAYEYPFSTNPLPAENEGSGIISDSNGNIYVIGSGTDANGLAHWLVRKSTDAGAHWTNVDDFLYSSTIPPAGAIGDYGSSASAIGISNSGTTCLALRQVGLSLD